MSVFGIDNGWNTTDMTVDNTTQATTESSAAWNSWMHIKDTLDKVQYVSLPTILVIGLFGNVMSILTMASRQFSHMSSRYVLIALALSDTVLLLTQPLNKLFVQQLFGIDLRAFSNTSCKAFFHIFKTAKMTSSWLIIMLCFERYIAVMFPLKVKVIIQKRFIFAAIAANYIIIGGYNAIWTFSSEVVNGVCKPDVVYADTKERFKNFLITGCSLYSFIPTAILLFLTPQIIYKITVQRRLRRMMSMSSITSIRKDDEMIRISIMLIGVMAAYIVFVLPITVLHVYAFFRGVSAFDLNSLSFFVYREISQILEQLNYAINFFFYVLCSRQFRRRVGQILTCNLRVSNTNRSRSRLFTVSKGLRSVSPVRSS